MVVRVEYRRGKELLYKGELIGNERMKLDLVEKVDKMEKVI